MYFSELTIGLLLAGILPIVIAGVQVSKEGFTGFLSLRFLSIAFIWLGYHFSPFIAYLSDIHWKSFLLVPDFVDAGLCFSTLSMCCIVVGGGLLKPRSFVSRRNKLNRPRRLQIFTISNRWLCVILIVNILLFIINVGGIDDIWSATYGRGEGQFELRLGKDKFFHVLRVLSMPLSVFSASIATLSVLQQKKKISTNILGYLILISASLESIHSFSRAAGFPLLIFAFLVLLIKHEKGIFKATVAVFIAFFLGSVGLHHRSYYSPGLYNFIKAVEEYEFISTKNEVRVLIGPGDNPLDAMAPWTRKTLSREQEESNSVSFDLISRLLWNLQPFPSEIVPVKSIGRDLSEVMGTWGQFRITTPAMAELYYVFGMPGALLFILLGRMFLFFDKRFFIQPDVSTTVCLLLCFVSLPVGLHSGMRAMTRPLLYALVIYFIVHKNWKTIFKYHGHRYTKVRV
ncbi:MAG: hypothetical protein F9K32_14935 [Desulfobulbaceae bacterium]|nr:MAG: hypothetical protein F9K32_14935 [Desulfobulbaceae bacterium]